MTNKKKPELYTVISSLVIIGAFLVVLMVSLLSEHGIHPDEFDVKACIDWSMSHWIWPDMRLKGSGLGDTYSWYGYTKVCNYTVYFLIASKIAYIFKLFMGAWPYYRMPNLLLALFMLIIMLRSVKEKKYLMLGFGVCVQAWYIFSYVTADALDFVLAFMAVFLLADEESVLWKVLEADNEYPVKKQIGICILLGILYGLMLLGKPYYYSIHVLTFVVLLRKLLNTGREHRAELWKKYICILGVCLVVFGVRASIDFAYYGTEKAAVAEEMREIYASEDKKPSTPVEKQLQTYHAYEKGYPLSYIFEDDPDWFAKSFRSYAGARITVDGENIYFVLMGALYIGIYVMIGIGLLLSDNKDNRLLFIVGTILCIGAVVASVLNSYLIDSQPQGRYLLPIALIVCYMSSRVRKIWENKVFVTMVVVAACLSVAYFGLVDSRKLIDLGYVRTLIG